MQLNILCQSPVSEGMTQTDAVRNTSDLAVAADQLGYHRFWVAEHHSDQALASAAPEVMISHIAARTERIRVGAGGVLLPYYKPLKVAEQFNLLAALYGDRIDLGLGRSGGSEGHAPQALGMRAPDQHPAAVRELLSWLGRGSASRPFHDTQASPRLDDSAQPWILGTSPTSAEFAGRNGLPYAFGGFLDPRALVPALTAYHQHFAPSPWLDQPRVNLGWYVQAAETEAEAHALTSSSEAWFLQTFFRGGNPVFPHPDAAAQLKPQGMESFALAFRRQHALVGTAEQVVEGLHRLQKQFAVDEFTLVTIPWSHEARVHSYELIAKTAGLAQQATPQS